MSGQPGSGKNHGKEIGNIISDAFHNGDLSRLQDLGPAVQEAVKDIPGVKININTGHSAPAGHSGPAVHQPPQSEEAEYTQLDPPYQNHGTYPYYKQKGQGKGMGVPKGVFSIVFGVLGMVVFGLCALSFAALTMILGGGTVLFPLTVACGGLFVGSMFLTSGGVSKNRLGRRALEYLALFSNKMVYTFDELAAHTGRSPKAIRKEVRKLSHMGYLQDMHTDSEETMLMRGDYTYQQYLESQKVQQEKIEQERLREQRLDNPETAGIEMFRSEGEKMIQKIREANRAIPGQEISDKLSQLESTCVRIFTYVEAHPEKLPETRKFMEYYLPTTLKLVEKYEQYEKMDFQPENVKEIKAQIESSLGTIDDAFNNLLEGLYQHDTLDVATDIVVLQSMLEQEGLTGKKFDIDEGGTIASVDSIHLTTGK